MLHFLPDDLRTGVESIDLDHARLYSLAAEFRDAAIKEIDTETLRRAVSVLVDHSVIHFRREEALMRETDYPHSAYEAHRKAHYTLWRTCLDLVESCEASDYDAVCGVRIATIIFTWLEHHVEVWDRAFIRFLKARPHAA